MQKVLKVILALSLAFILPVSALGASVTNTMTIPNDSDTEVFSADALLNHGRGDDGYLHYWLVNAAGEEITPHYYRISSTSYPRLATFIAGTESNKCGLLDAGTGEIIIPAEYGDIDLASDKWVFAVRLVLSTDENAPYITLFSDDRYDIVDVDVYYGAQKMVTLTKEEWGYSSVYGSYLQIRNDTSYIWLNAAGEVTTYERSSSTSSEFSEDYRTHVVTHTASSQEAFVPGCTLTPADVDKAFWMKEEGIVDLQGNVILAREDFPHEELELDDSHGDYLLISYDDEETSQDLHGVMDKTGKIIIPCSLAELPTLSCQNPWFTNGTLAALTPDNQLNFYDATGAILNSVDMTPYGEDLYFDLDDSIIHFRNSDDQYVYITASKGVLDTSAYEEVNHSYSDVFLNVKQNGLWGVMDMNGELIIPCTHRYALSFNGNSTLAEGISQDENGDRTHNLYTIEH